MLSISDASLLIHENSGAGKTNIVKDKKTGKEYEVIKKSIRINGNSIPLTFKRELDTNKLIPNVNKKKEKK